MAPFLRTIPAVLAVLVLGAHFYRAGSLVPVAACLALVPVLFVRRPAVRLACRLCLAAGAVVWIVTAARISRYRMAGGQPYLRMLAILCAVAAFTAFAAWLLPAARGSGPLEKASQE